MAKQCYYEVLGIDRGAGDSEIKSAFRRLAKECHPDRHGGDPTAEDRFKIVNEAYEVLKDPQRRAAYDRFGHAAFDGRSGFGGFGGGASAHGFGSDFSESMSAMFDDLFGEFMGARRPRQRSGRARGADLRYNMQISLAEAYEGRNAQIRVPTSVTCEDCSGSGAKAGTAPVTCRTCGGAGKVRASQGFFTIERPCPTCEGRGEIIEDPCPSCDGAGRVTRERTLSVTIPVGVEDGTRIRLAGEGEAGLRGGPPGDLYIFLAIKPHEFFQRDGADLFCRVPISMTTAALGGQIEVPTIDGGRSRVKIPEGSESGRQFRLKGKGMPVLRSKQQGDLYIQVEVETPKNLTRKQRDLLREFEAESNAQTSPESEGFFARVKEFFDGIGE
ncbi:molecular chaperone DnaJ [Methyloceanibacter methanicus]|uniref:Chaperone protein DnaJ n=1 Tax=Methyloceanibacter methanicus TaxID=1774968 RepID=A0A1E3W692_9HYPH|nr:molecular chaperone DnaJ [Methyloceanibacter methanicus]ODS01260.1 molecular chaperone DnaJ [Methyloceanibacter methanicus]